MVKRGCPGDASILKPTVMAAVPLMLDRIYKAINEKVKKVPATTITTTASGVTDNGEKKPLLKNLSTTSSTSKNESKSSNILLKCPKCTFSTTTQMGLLKHTKQEHGKR